MRIIYADRNADGATPKSIRAMSFDEENRRVATLSDLGTGAKLA